MLDAAAYAGSVVNFKINILSDIELSIGRDSIDFKTASTPKIKEYFGRDGLWLNTPEISAQTQWCLPTCILSIGLSKC